MNNKILVVDDDPAARKMLTLLLETTGEILLASSGEEALRVIETHRPRLMLLDMVMPGMGGLEVLAAARGAAAPMTIIMLTGENDVELAKRALELGAAEYVTKPFDLRRLKERVERSMAAVPGDDKNLGGVPWRTAETKDLSRKEGKGGGPVTGETPEVKIF